MRLFHSDIASWGLLKLQWKISKEKMLDSFCEARLVCTELQNTSVSSTLQRMECESAQGCSSDNLS